VYNTYNLEIKYYKVIRDSQMPRQYTIFCLTLNHLSTSIK